MGLRNKTLASYDSFGVIFFFVAKMCINKIPGVVATALCPAPVDTAL